MLSLPLLSRSGRKGQRDRFLLLLYFCLCLSRTEYPELEGSWKDGVKVTGIKICFIFLFHFGGRIWEYLCNLPCLDDASTELVTLYFIASGVQKGESETVCLH